jgi:mono/diheme cytochrome c family protein
MTDSAFVRNRQGSSPNKHGQPYFWVPLAIALLALLASCKPAEDKNLAQAPLTGREIYQARCIACHQADGGGIPGICPPLLNSPLLAGPPEVLIHVLLLGRKGPLVRGGTTYNGVMPAWKFDLTDAQITAVINDLYTRWNPAAAPITGDMVRKIRDQTAKDKLFPVSLPEDPS